MGLSFYAIVTRLPGFNIYLYVTVRNMKAFYTVVQPIGGVIMIYSAPYSRSSCGPRHLDSLLQISSAYVHMEASGELPAH
uniref:AlNc14C1G63 protein n=1 Tax=Albugo laibachii Nc14 TaxID=890382 RepID=F0VYR1_9STRA|nr:AlNc14C1G63 [Albugo laibachii Nc14]|eukprot:CCA13925.1 AlNc14C1G63 [Albugo laibachii Nc14]